MTTTTTTTTIHQRLPGPARTAALRMLMVMNRDRLGMLTRLVDDDEQVLPVAQELATRLAAGATVAYGAIKRELSIGDAGTLSDALAAEAQAQTICGRTTDHKNAVEAFVAKRKPIFDGQ